jgi:hypothetical protein
MDADRYDRLVTISQRTLERWERAQSLTAAGVALHEAAFV